MSEQEIFQLLGSRALESVKDIGAWKSVSLKIKRLERNVGFECFYLDADGKTVAVDTSVDYKTAKSIHALYEITQSHPLQHQNWNRAIFTLFPGNQFDMEYIWDQELQDRVDQYNKS